MKRFVAGVLWSLLVWTPLVAEESNVDGLFDDPAPDTVADPSVKLTQDLLASQNVRFFESVQADGFYVMGWTREDGEFRQTPYNALNFSFGTDARLDKNIRAYASFFITYPTIKDSSDNLYNPYQDLMPNSTNLTFSNVAVKEVFLDYSLADAVFLRVGRESLTWGQGRIFNPTNFVGALARGVGAKLSTSVLGLTVSGVAMKNDGYFKLSSDSIADLAGLDTLGLAGKIEGSWLLFSGGASVFHHANIGDKGEAYVKSSIAGFDLFGEGLVERRLSKGVAAGELVPSVLGGLYREFGTGSPWLQMQVEYLVSGRGPKGGMMEIPEASQGLRDQSVGVGATSGLLNFIKTKPSLSWLHALADRSGQLLFGFTNTALQHLDLTAGVVWIYGPLTGRYVVDNPDPLDRRVMLTLKASFSFDINN